MIHTQCGAIQMFWVGKKFHLGFSIMSIYSQPNNVITEISIIGNIKYLRFQTLQMLQRIGASDSTSALLMIIQDWFPLR